MNLDGHAPHPSVSIRGSPSFPNFAPMQLRNYACGQWVAGTGKQTELTDAVTGETTRTGTSDGFDR
jgi:hypothetical protein